MLTSLPCTATFILHIFNFTLIELICQFAMIRDNSVQTSSDYDIIKLVIHVNGFQISSNGIEDGIILC